MISRPADDLAECQPASSMSVRRARPLLGTFVEIRASGLPLLRLNCAVENAFAAVERVQRLMSFHERTSDVSRLNESAVSESVAVHPWTYEVLETAKRMSELSGGLFDVTIGSELAKWGLLPGEKNYSDRGSYRDVLLLSGRRIRFLAPLQLDLGGIGKGFAVDRALSELRSAGVENGYVNAGGDIGVFGSRSERIHIRDASRPGTLLPLLDLQNGALACSSPVETASVFCGRAVSALINGRSREPITGSATVAVLAPSCMIADAATKIALCGDEYAPLLASFAARVFKVIDGEMFVLDTAHG